MIKNQLNVIGIYKGNIFKEYSVSTTKQRDYLVKKKLQIPFKIENSGFHRFGHVPEVIGDFQPMTSHKHKLIKMKKNVMYYLLNH